MSDTNTKSKYKKVSTCETLLICLIAIVTVSIMLVAPKLMDLVREQSRFENLLNSMERAVSKGQGIRKVNGWYYFYLKNEYYNKEMKNTLKPRVGLSPIDGWFSNEWQQVFFEYQNGKKIVKGPFLISTDESIDFYLKNHMSPDGEF